MDSKTTVRYLAQYFEGGWDITGQPYASVGADEIRVYDGTSTLLVRLRRTPDQKWRIASALGILPEDMYDDSYVDMGSALTEIGEEWSVEFVRED